MTAMLKHTSVVLALLGAVTCGGGGGAATNPTTPSTPTPPPVTTFTLSGQVTDSLTTIPIAGATVSVLDGTNAGKSTTTNSSGNYTLSGLQQSGFTIRATANDYVAAEKSLTLTANTTLSFQLHTAGPRTRFGAGTYLVNKDIASGRYYGDPGDGCYWERLSGLGGTLGEIITNDFVGYDAEQYIVDIRGSDLAFKTDADCGTWNNTPQKGAQSSIPPGIWLVNVQITPGTYRANVSSGCYWERLRDFTGSLSGVIANDFVSSAGSQLVSIRASDTGFSNDGDCGTWTRVSGLTASEAQVESSSGDVQENWLANRARKAASIDGARRR